MRGSSLSHAKVVELLNAHFLPVYTANEDYRDGGAAPADEVAAGWAGRGRNGVGAGRRGAGPAADALLPGDREQRRLKEPHRRAGGAGYGRFGEGRRRPRPARRPAADEAPVLPQGR